MVENITEETAVRMVRNWVEYGAEASVMPEAVSTVRSVRPVSVPPDSVLTDTIRSSAPNVPVVMVVTGGRAQLQAIGDAGR